MSTVWTGPLAVATACLLCHATLAQNLEFSSYWGTGGANNRTVVVDHAGNIYMSGGTSQPDWPTTFGPAHAGHGESDVTIAKFAPDGKLIWARLLGGPSEDYAYVSAVGPKGELYVSGRAGPGFPTTLNAFDRTFNGGTTVGKAGFFGPVVDPQGNVYCTGRFRSKDCPLTPNACQSAKAGTAGTQDAVLAVFSADGRRLLHATYFGGSGTDHGRHIGIHPGGRFECIIGETGSKDLPLHHAVQSRPSGAFLAKFAIKDVSQSP